ncbi:MAG: hypothetical protein AB7O60_10775 [Variibacter sp.]
MPPTGLARGDLAADLGDIRTSIAAETAIARNYLLVGKLLGQLVQIHDVRHTNLLVSPDYINLRQTLIAALKPFPEAARAVGAALHALESEAAKDITSTPAVPLLIEHEPATPAVPLPVPPK